MHDERRHDLDQPGSRHGRDQPGAHERPVGDSRARLIGGRSPSLIGERPPSPVGDRPPSPIGDSRALAALSDDELLRGLAEILRQSRRVEKDLVAHIAEVDARRLYAREAFPSMFAYCTEALHLSESEAYLRIVVARASREHPALLPLLEDGRLHLSGIALLAPHLTAENRETLLRRATHRSKRQVEELVAELKPREDVPTLMRRLPDRGARPAATPSGMGREVTPSQRSVLPALASPSAIPPSAVSAPPGSPPSVSPPSLSPLSLSPPSLSPLSLSPLPLSPPSLSPLSLPPLSLPPPSLSPPSLCAPPASEPPASSSPAPGSPPPHPVVRPLAPGRYRVQFTASARLCEKLEQLQALLRSSIPDGDLAAVVELAVTQTLERLEARRFGKVRPSTNTPREGPRPEITPRQTTAPGATADRSRHIPAAVRREVYERDGGRCRYVDERGRRCTARRWLEFHHRLPFGHGGGHSLENISLLCRAHNGFLAEIDYGPRARAGPTRA